MRLDRTTDARKMPQVWSARWVKPTASSRGSWRWVVTACLIACAAFLAMSAILGLALRWTIAAREAESRDLVEAARAQVLIETERAALESIRSSDARAFHDAADQFSRDEVREVSPGVVDRTFLERVGQDVARGEPAAAVAVAPAAGGWGHLRGRFVVQGTVPALPKLAITQDVAYCSKCNVPNESIVVGPNQELANVVIWLRDKPSEIHESYKKAEAADVVLDNHKCHFAPHVGLLRTTQTLVLKNSDPMAHNVKFDSFQQAFNELVGAGASVKKTLSIVETVPAPIGCNVHPWMRGYLLVRDHPYMAVTGTDGALEIKNLPAGEWEFQAWHEVKGYLAVGDWKRGRFKVTIEADKSHDLGTIEVPAKLLEPR